MKNLSTLIILLVTAIAATASQAMADARFALLIGNKSYASTVGPLKNPHNDIRVVRDALIKTGFARSNIVMVKDADRFEILQAVDEYAEKLNSAEPDAIGFFYYSGHGVANLKRGKNYIIPVGVKNLHSKTFWYRAVALGEDVIDRLNRAAPNAAHFVVFDACRNELLLPQKGGKGFVAERTRPGMLIAYATDLGATASDAGKNSGPYATALAARLSKVKKGDRATVIFEDVKYSVYGSTEHSQFPWHISKFTAPVLLGGRGSDKPSKPVTPRPPFSGASRIERDWKLAAGSNNIFELGDFALSYKGRDSFYERRAARKLRRLVRASTDEGALREFSSSYAGLPVAKQAANRADRLKLKREEARYAKEGRFRVAVGLTGSEVVRWLKPKDTFSDFATAPEMVMIPAGWFMMGSPQDEKGHDDDEDDKPGKGGRQVKVTIASPFAMGRFEVTNAQYVAFLNAVKKRGPEGQPWFETKKEDARSQITGSTGRFKVERGKAAYPVVNVSWYGADAYVKWLSEKTGQKYRLPSESQWEYAARAGTKGPFSWRGKISTARANYDGAYTYDGSKKGKYHNATVPVESFDPNAFGLYQVHGNVWEWVEDCYVSSYKGAPLDGSARTKKTVDNCKSRVLRGGSWDNFPGNLRSANRIWVTPDYRIIYNGFRVARVVLPARTLQ